MKEMLFKSSAVVAALNQVEGFNPAEYARVIQKEGQQDQLYLDVAIRKLWFRLKHPVGKIKKIVLGMSENMAAVEARIYLDKNDPEDQYIACGFSQKFRTMDDVFGDKFMEMAETAAIGRALAEAGFGIQFADVSGERDDEQVDAGIAFDGNTALPVGAESFAPAMEMPGYPQAPTQPQAMPPQQPYYQNQFQPVQNAPTQSIQGQTSSGQSVPVQNMAQGQPLANTTSQPINRQAPIETLYTQMNYEQAVKVVIRGNGKWAGKTLGQITVESPSTVQFFAGDGYKGPDNLVRVAARIILEKAQAA